MMTFSWKLKSAPLYLLFGFFLVLGLTSCEGDLGFDPAAGFAGSGTTLLVAQNLERKAIGVELDSEYCELAKNRIAHSICCHCVIEHNLVLMGGVSRIAKKKENDDSSRTKPRGNEK